MTPDRPAPLTVVPAVYVFALRDTQESPGGTEVLLQLRRGTGYLDGHWAADAAGHVERGETALEAAAREAHEELGVTEVLLDFLTTVQRTAGGLPIDERVDFFFTTGSWVGEPRIMEPDRCADLHWWSSTRLPQPVAPHERQVLDQLASGSVPALQAFGFAN